MKLQDLTLKELNDEKEELIRKYLGEEKTSHYRKHICLIEKQIKLKTK